MNTNAILLNNSSINTENINFAGNVSFSDRIEFVIEQLESNKNGITKEFCFDTLTSIISNLKDIVTNFKEADRDNDVNDIVIIAIRGIKKIEKMTYNLSDLINIMNPELADYDIMKYSLRTLDMEYIKGIDLDDLDLEEEEDIIL